VSDSSILTIKRNSFYVVFNNVYSVTEFVFLCSFYLF